MTRGEEAFFVKTAPSPLVLSPSPKKLSSGRSAGPRRWLAAGRKGHVWSWGREKEGGGKLGREDAGVFSFSRSRLLPGHWNTSGSMGRGLPAMKRPSGEPLDNGCKHAAGRDALRAEDRLLRMSGSEGVFGDTRAAMPKGLVGLPGGCCLMVGPERRGEAGRSEIRAGILRLGAALPGRLMPGRGPVWRAPVSVRHVRWLGWARVELSPRSSFRAGGGPQDAKKPSMWRALSFPMGGQASGTVLGRAYGHVCHWAGMPYHLKKWPEREALGKGAPHVRGAPSVDVRFVCVRS